MLPAQAFAESNCLPLNNGGLTSQQYCQFPTPTAVNNGSQQTNSGQPVYPAMKTSTTPDTGPASWSLVGLLILGGLGFWLRKKTKFA